jgi:quinolinate synthase
VHLNICKKKKDTQIFILYHSYGQGFTKSAATFMADSFGLQKKNMGNFFASLGNSSLQE